MKAVTTIYRDGEACQIGLKTQAISKKQMHQDPQQRMLSTNLTIQNGITDVNNPKN